ncbi:flagellar export protein FliJ [Aliiglaciecola sp. SL4]|uniref:flagellar export protein FliJ n=1 Tax=Aliiglaciecola sp. SL4 TaxID=3239806 RepID=UPI00355B5128
MAERQLELVARWEKDKEDRLAQDFQLAQQHAELNKQKLTSLEGYRLDYLRQTQMKSAGILNIDKFNKLHSFIGKLDKACQQQMQVHNQAVLVAEQRRDLWLAQQRKRKAVEMLLDKKRQAREVRNNKLEQLFMDELSTQRFIRNQ